MIRYPGGFRTSTYVAPTTSAAKGSWSLVEQLQAQKAGIWPIPFNGAVSYLVVAGGGGGGWSAGGGGGAGGLLSSSTTLSSGVTYTVTIGAGGAGGDNGHRYGYTVQILY